MTTIDDTRAAPSGELLSIPADECMALISHMSVGRLAVARPHQAPLVFPVNYVVQNGAVLFRTDSGSKLDALRSLPVSFEVDDIDPSQHTGWSVLIRGFAHHVSAGSHDPEPWTPGPKPYWVRIHVEEISGRRLVGPVLALDVGGYL